MKLYGSLNNRFDENKNFTGREIRVGDDITMYLWSDRHPYFVTKVIDQEHIYVHKYHVCADHSKEGGRGHQNWLYFKTLKEHNQYINSLHLKDLNGKEYEPYNENPKEPKDIEIKFVRGKWREVHRYTREGYDKALADGNPMYGYTLTPKQRERMMAGKEVLKYSEFGNISFGVRSYYYDWEF